MQSTDGRAVEDPARAAGRLAGMLTIRRFEEQVIRLYEQGTFPGHYHVYIGQESTAVAACEALRDGDYVLTTHRNHGHLLARGGDPGRLLAEILGKVDGYNRGKGGTFHVATRELGILTTSAIVGGSLPIATGVALGLKRLGQTDGITMAFFGDGVLEEGAFYEAINLAALWRVPVVYVCENNKVPGARRSSTLSVSRLAEVPRVFGIPAEAARASEVDALARLFHRVVEVVRAGRGPYFVEVETGRWPGNVGQRPELVGGEMDLAWAWGARRPPDALAAWVKTGDPLLLYVRTLLERGFMSPAQVLEIDRRVRARMQQAVQFALASPYPPAAEAYVGAFAG